MYELYSYSGHWGNISSSFHFRAITIFYLALGFYFRAASGNKNEHRDKSEANWIGASSNYRHKPGGLKWSNAVVKCLGIYIGPDSEDVTRKNFTEKI